MHSSTTSYIALQNLFKEQHSSEIFEFREILGGVLSSINLPSDAISNEETESFVKGTGSVQIVKGNSLRASKEGNDLLQKYIGKLTL